MDEISCIEVPTFVGTCVRGCALLCPRSGPISGYLLLDVGIIEWPPIGWEIGCRAAKRPYNNDHPIGGSLIKNILKYRPLYMGRAILVLKGF